MNRGEREMFSAKIDAIIASNNEVISAIDRLTAAVQQGGEEVNTLALVQSLAVDETKLPPEAFGTAVKVQDRLRLGEKRREQA